MLAGIFSAGMLAGCSSPPPEPPATEFTGSPADYQTSLFECLKGEGFEVKAADTAGEPGQGLQPVGVDTPEKQTQFREAMDMCVAGIPPRPEPDTPERLTAFYGKWIERWDCLNTAGFVLEERPSEEAFTDAYHRGEANSTPQDLLPPDQQTAAYEACPIPTDEFW